MVTFESSLANTVADGGTAVATVSPEGLPSGTDGNNVSLPAELALESQTNLENQSVADSLNSQFAILSTAVTG